MAHYKKIILAISLILAISFAAIVPACSIGPGPVHHIRVFKAMPKMPPWFSDILFLDPPEPHPDFMQGPFSPGDKMNLGLVISKENKEDITFSKYTFTNKRTGYEVEVGRPEDLGPFEPGQVRFIAYINPWLVPEQPDIYELRIYVGNDVVASVLFEVKKHEFIDSIGISKIGPGVAPSFGPIVPETPYPDFVQEVLNLDDKIYLGLVINEENKEAVTFSKYAFYNKRTGQETVIETPPGDLGPFQPGQLIIVAFDNPWAVPEQPGTYEIRIYVDNEVMASAIFEVQ